MHIAKISLWAHKLTFATPYAWAGGRLTGATTLILRMETEDGIIGWGESCPLGSTYAPAFAQGGVAAVQCFAPALIGKGAAPRVLNQAMDQALDGHSYAKALVDIAAWDILGKRANLPLCDLLGGALSRPVPSYFAFAPATPNQAATQAAAKAAEGYGALQIKIGADPRVNADLIRAAWDALPPGVALAADANRAMLVEDALHLSRMIADLPVALEQPCATAEDMRRLRPRISHPIYWDESTLSPRAVLDALGRGECDGLGMKLTRVGGVSGMLAVRDMAVAKRVRLSVDDSWGGDIIAAACAHLGATVPPDLNRGTWLAQPYIGAHYGPQGVTINQGKIHLPPGPGLGLNPDPALFGTPLWEVSEHDQH